MKRLITRSILAVLAVTCAACSQVNEQLTYPGGYMFKPAVIGISARQDIVQGYWDPPKKLRGEHKIVVDTERQRAYYYIDNHQVGMSPVSSGKAGHDTPKGEFKILDKDIDHESSTYGSIVDAKGRVLVADYTVGQPRPAGGRYKGAAMNYGMQITRNGIWMHEGAVTKATESHGCIRLPREMAKIFFENTPIGSTVIIK